ARGNFSLWNANQRFQCYWRGEEIPGVPKTLPAFAGPGRNGNMSALSGIEASAEEPSRAEHALPVGSTGDFVARVEVCKPGLIGTENCKQYPKLNYKPIGLL